MIHILLFILKLIGWILLVVLGILFLVLFAPIRYQGHAKSTIGWKDFYANFKFSWLLSFVYGKLNYENGKLLWDIRIGWKHFPKMQTSDPPNTVKKSEPKKKTQKTIATKKKKEKKASNSSKQTSSKKEMKISNLTEKIKKILETKENIAQFLRDEIHQMGFQHCIKELKRLFKLLKPKIIKGELEYGFCDPCYTGQVLGILSILYPYLGNNLNITPNFHEKVFKGNCFVKGKLRVSYFLLIVWNLIWNTNSRTTFLHIKNLKQS